MTPDILRRWAQTLEDNEHLRTQFAEREDGPGGACYCAFGMLGRLYERDTNGIIFRDTCRGSVEAYMNYDDRGFLAWLGADAGWHHGNAIVGKVVDMNDTGISWKEIAQMLRAEAESRG
jgi:hypothetical protein